jgi:hypothetical protein
MSQVARSHDKANAGEGTHELREFSTYSVVFVKYHPRRLIGMRRENPWLYFLPFRRRDEVHATLQIGCGEEERSNNICDVPFKR